MSAVVNFFLALFLFPIAVYALNLILNLLFYNKKETNVESQLFSNNSSNLPSSTYI